MSRSFSKCAIAARFASLVLLALSIDPVLAQTTMRTAAVIASYNRKDLGEPIFLDAEMNHVADPEGMWSEGEPEGKGVMVPGALHGLESIHQRFGKLPWSRLVQPAIEVAKNGFPVDESYAGTAAYRATVLKSTPYAERTFFRQGEPLRAGDRLVQPELALFLEPSPDTGARR